MPSDPTDHELLAFVQAMLSNFDRQLREPAVLAQAISDHRAHWVTLYQASLEFEDRPELETWPGGRDRQERRLP